MNPRVDARSTSPVPSETIPVSAFIITFNNAHEIKRCLTSLDFVREVIVVDSGSTDGTQDICRSMGATVIDQPFLGYYKQLQFAEGRCTCDWAINLYADETVSLELREELIEKFRSDPSVNGFRVRRRNYLQKRWIYKANYYPSWHMRVFRRSAGGHIPRELHQKIRVNGRAGRLRGAIDHWWMTNEGDIFDNMVEYARIEAKVMIDEGETVTVRHFFRAWWLFIQRFIIFGGWKQGALGAVVSILPVCSTALKYIIAWERQNERFLNTPDETWLSAQRIGRR